MSSTKSLAAAVGTPPAPTTIVAPQTKASQFTSPTEFKALYELFPFRANRPRPATEQTLPQVCSEQHTFVLQLPKPLREGWCLAIKRDVGGGFSVQIRLNVDLLEKTMVRVFSVQSEREAIYQQAHDYLNQEATERQLDRLADDPVGVPLPPACSNGDKCVYYVRGGTCFTGNHHPLCTTCNYAIPLHHAFRDSASNLAYAPQDYVLLKRMKCYRDILLMPEANKAGLPHTNAQLIVDAGAWAVICGTAKKLASAAQMTEAACFVEWHINFGKWESAVAKSQGTTDCHPHVHLLLTREAVPKIAAIHPDFTGFFDVPEDDDHLRDCALLRARLPTDHLSARIDALETKVDANHKALETKVDALETKVDALGTKMDELIAALGGPQGRGQGRGQGQGQGRGQEGKGKAEQGQGRVSGQGA